jgi:glycosyltransferase involved in cell wall biosynthesis
MSTGDVVMVAPYPGLTARSPIPSGVAAYTERLTAALGDEGVRVHVVAPQVSGEPPLERVTTNVTVERCFRRGPGALPLAARAATKASAPLVHLQYETFLFGGPSSVPGVVPALFNLRGHRRGPVVTMHQVVDPASVDRSFTELHRVRVPHQVARAGLSCIQRTVQTLSAATVVHEHAFAQVIPDSVVMPIGIDFAGTARSDAVRSAKQTLGLHPERLTAMCFGFLSPYKGYELALDAAELAGDSVELLVAGGPHPRLEGHDGYAEDLRRRYGHVARFDGYVDEPDVSTYFRAADVLLLPYPAPFASSGPLAQALGFGTSILCSEALARCVDAPSALVAPSGRHGWAKRLLELSSDPRKIEALRSETHRLAAGRTWTEVARRHIAMYEEVMHARRTARRRVRPGEPG